MNIYRLPDGKETKSFRRYRLAWRKLCKPIEDLTGLRYTAFDPDVRFEFGTKKHIALPVWFLNLLNNALQAEESKKSKKKIKVLPSPIPDLRDEALKFSEYSDLVDRSLARKFQQLTGSPGSVAKYLSDLGFGDPEKYQSSVKNFWQTCKK